MMGALTSTDGAYVSPVFFALSKSFPERTPHQSVALAISAVVRLMTNSFVRQMMG
jgi:hypothetical protein